MVVFALCTLALAVPLASSGGSHPAVSCSGQMASNAFSQAPAAAPVVNGRVFVGTVTIGPNSQQPASHEAATYGATTEAVEAIRVRVPGLFGFEFQGRSFEISPWQSVTVDAKGNHWSNPYSTAHRKLAQRVESARQQWLKDNNFVGGVRTFVNDAAASKAAPAVPAKQAPHAQAGPAAIEPRAVIELPPEMPRLKAKMRVLAPDQSPARKTTASIKVVPQGSAPSAPVAAVPVASR